MTGELLPTVIVCPTHVLQILWESSLLPQHPSQRIKVRYCIDPFLVHDLATIRINPLSLGDEVHGLTGIDEPFPWYCTRPTFWYRRRDQHSPLRRADSHRVKPLRVSRPHVVNDENLTFSTTAIELPGEGGGEEEEQPHMNAYVGTRAVILAL